MVQPAHSSPAQEGEQSRSATSPSGPPPSPRDPPTGSDKRWPALLALLTAGLLPATTARRTDHAPFGLAFLVHLLAALATAGVILFLAAWEDVPGPATLDAVWDSALRFIASIERDLTRLTPVAAALAVCVPVLGIEAAYLLLGALTTPWGAGDEPLRTSLDRAVRRAWLHTPHVLLVVLLAGSLSVLLFRAQLVYVMDGYMADDGTWGHALDRGGPFYARYAEEIAVLSYFAGGAWWLWGLLRFVGAHRRRAPTARPPTCEYCGYNLTGIPVEGRCPECGEPCASSLGPDTRPGALWQRRRTVGRWRGWWRTAVDAGLRPVQFGRQLQMCRQVTDHRLFLALPFPVIFVIGCIGIIAGYVADQGHLPRGLDSEVIWAIGPVLGFFSVIAALFLAGTAAGLVGIAYRLRTKRNMMHGAMQAACYLSGYLTLWVTIAFISLAGQFALKDDLHGVADVISVDRGLLRFFAWLLPNLVCFAVYLHLVARITSVTRYANR